MGEDGQQGVTFYWLKSETPLGRRLHFPGGTYGFSSAVELLPEARLAVVLLANKSADGAQESLRALSAKIIDELRPEPHSRPQPADAPPANR